ncbi:hypothetical protein DYB26_013206 [Aphanomyces astaci]|uniref:Uncharacterized protein n=1 Tax=Aphanomyces astaci TaxID=112090 RepID=A0A418E9A8_APHAT|nr:hypothetical protein DYB26_013206 [Aphanomyces astaci]
MKFLAALVHAAVAAASEVVFDNARSITGPFGQGFSLIDTTWAVRFRTPAPDLPDCTKSIAFGFIPISDPVDGANYQYQWTPNPPIDVAFNTTYWFTVNSTSITWAKRPTWVEGHKKFYKANDPLGDVRIAYRNGGGPWTLLSLIYGRDIPSLQVHATYGS